MQRNQPRLHNVLIVFDVLGSYVFDFQAKNTIKII